MSYHLLHIFTHGAVLRKQRGCLTLVEPAPTKRVPIEDIRAVIIAARGVQISSSVFASVLANNGVFVHCDERYQPTGWSLPIERTRDSALLEAQLYATPHTKSAAARALINQKIRNQHAVLKTLAPKNPLDPLLLQREPDEALAARLYFQHMFSILRPNHPPRSDRRSGELNACLNYGYAVLSALVHRSAIVHGLISQLGVLHRSRYRSYPLVYDLMEPMRPFVDQMLVRFAQTAPDDPIESWARHVASGLRQIKVKHERFSIKLIDSIDIYVRSFVRCLTERKFKNLWAPSVKSEEPHEPKLERVSDGLDSDDL